MNTVLHRSLLLLVLVCTTVVAHAQVVELHQVVPDTITAYRFELRDGSVVQGHVITVDVATFGIRTAQLGDVSVPKTSVERVVRLDDVSVHAGVYWFPNPHDTRHLIGPSAIPLRKGEGYYQNTYLLLNSFAVGVTNHVSISGGFELLSTFASGGSTPIFFLTAKASGKVMKDLHVGAAGAYLSLPNFGSRYDERQRMAVGAVTGLVTYGTNDTQVTGGIGLSHDGKFFAKRPIFTLSTLLRFSRKAAFVSENWFVPDGTGTYAVFSYGLRFMGEKIAVDLAFINNKDIIQGIAIGIPFIDFAVKF